MAGTILKRQLKKYADMFIQHVEFGVQSVRAIRYFEHNGRRLAVNREVPDNGYFNVTDYSTGIAVCKGRLSVKKAIEYSKYILNEHKDHDYSPFEILNK